MNFDVPGEIPGITNGMKKLLFSVVVFTTLLGLSSCGTSDGRTSDDPYVLDSKLTAQLIESDYIRKPMKEFYEDSGMYRWERKKVLETREIPLVEEFSSVTNRDGGVISIDMNVTHSGKGSIRLDTPASGPVKKPTNRNYGSPEIVRMLPGEDLTEWNRFSCWVYVDAPGYYVVMLGFKLLNEGEKIMPTPGRFEGEHFVSVVPGEWTHVIWEIPDLYRDKVTGFTANIMMSGEAAGSSDMMHLYLDDMRLEKVEVENSRGFDLRKNAIAFSHNGYRVGTRKQAMVQNVSSKSFKVVDDVTGRTAFKGEGTESENGFVTMDFSSLEKQGRYTIEIDGIKSKPFFIGDAAYLATAWHLINFFFSERCGYEIPGIHQPCHEDVFIYHPDGRFVSLAGGWHDAGDLTQGVDNDAEAGVAMLELAEQVKERDPKLYSRLLEESRWGLNWLLKTRFGDGYRASSIIIGILTKNIRGDKDDMQAPAQRKAGSNFHAAEFEAMAVPFYESEDPVFARWCRNSAVEDFAFAAEDFDKMIAADQGNGIGTVLYGLALTSAMRLYNLTGEEKYIDRAVQYARGVMTAQDREIHSDWDIPVSGFFYENTARKRPLDCTPSEEHRMIQGLAMLLKAKPNHKESKEWLASLKAFAGYVKTAAGLGVPYGLLPATIYEVDNTDISNLYHEGERIGLPSKEEFNAQVKNGIRLNDSIYLRRFAVGYQARGFNGTTLVKAKLAFVLADVLQDEQLKDIATRQVEWITGYNPFAMSTIYGDGYDYPLLYGAYAGNVVGAVPVGIETFENIDEPYFPMQANCTYKEIWTYSTARMISCVAELFKYK